MVTKPHFSVFTLGAYTSALVTKNVKATYIFDIQYSNIMHNCIFLSLTKKW